VLDESSWNVEAHYAFRQWQAPRTVPLATLLRAGRTDEALFAVENAAFDILPPPPGYLLVNVGCTGQIDRFQLGVQVRNALNQRYRSYTDRLRYFADEVGRNVMVSVEYTF
jgi:iron complex outermembrane receptor protein